MVRIMMNNLAYNYYFIVDHEECNEGEVRLVNGTVKKEGRLEICNNGIWGGICSYSFTQIDGYIACKQMGYDNGMRILPCNTF